MPDRPIRPGQSEPRGEKKSKTEKAPPGQQAVRLMRSAKAATKDSNGAPTPEADFLMKQASVMAMLELADAVRGSRQQ
jgi:hypothetical protein